MASQQISIYRIYFNPFYSFQQWHRLFFPADRLLSAISKTCRDRQKGAASDDIKRGFDSPSTGVRAGSTPSSPQSDARTYVIFKALSRGPCALSSAHLCETVAPKTQERGQLVRTSPFIFVQRSSRKNYLLLFILVRQEPIAIARHPSCRPAGNERNLFRDVSAYIRSSRTRATRAAFPCS